MEPAPADAGDQMMAPRALSVGVELRTDGVTYLARHGQTESNLLKRYAGYSAELLTPLGRSQMGQLAARVGLLGIAEIWTSELARTRESAELVGAVLELPVKVDSRLNELRMGPWEGLTEQEAAERFPDAYALWCTMPDQVRIEGRETLDVLAARVREALNDARRHPRPVLLITHVAPARVAILTALNLSLRLYRRVHVGNGDCFRVRHAPREVYDLAEDRSLRSRLERALAGPESSVA